MNFFKNNILIIREKNHLTDVSLHTAAFNTIDIYLHFLLQLFWVNLQKSFP